MERARESHVIGQRVGGVLENITGALYLPSGVRFRSESYSLVESGEEWVEPLGMRLDRDAPARRLRVRRQSRRLARRWFAAVRPRRLRRRPQRLAQRRRRRWRLDRYGCVLVGNWTVRATVLEAGARELGRALVLLLGVAATECATPTRLAPFARAFVPLLCMQRAASGARAVCVATAIYVVSALSYCGRRRRLSASRPLSSAGASLPSSCRPPRYLSAPPPMEEPSPPRRLASASSSVVSCSLFCLPACAPRRRGRRRAIDVPR